MQIYKRKKNDISALSPFLPDTIQFLRLTRHKNLQPAHSQKTNLNAHGLSCHLPPDESQSAGAQVKRFEIRDNVSLLPAPRLLPWKVKLWPMPTHTQ